MKQYQYDLPMVIYAFLTFKCVTFREKKCNNALFSYIFSLYFAKKYHFFAFDQLKLILKVYCCVYEIP